jgi:DNA-3-methyladenine glycosylase
MQYLDAEFFARDTLTVARDLVGTTLVVGRCRGRIVETEAYTTDAASHAVTRRHQASWMGDTFGHIYIFFIYGMYYCLNFTTDRDGVGAVLIRAAEPLAGQQVMAQRRGTTDPRKLCTGPGRLCQAFGIDLAFNGRKLGGKLKLAAREGDEPVVVTSRRIGISQAQELEWRFFEEGSKFVSG